MAGLVKKGALVLAFAAAVGGSTYMFQQHYGGPSLGFGGGSQPTPTATQQTPVEKLHINPNLPPAIKAAAIAGQEASDWQMRTEKFQKGFKEGKVSKADLDEVIKYDNDKIAQARAPFIGQEGLKFFDKAFQDMVKAKGGTPPEKMPEVAHPTTQPGKAPTTQPKAGPPPGPKA